MAGFYYRFNVVGWIGALLFVLPTPISALYFQSSLRISEAKSAYDRALAEIGGTPEPAGLSLTFFVLMGTLTLIGLVMVIVGRDSVPR